MYALAAWGDRRHQRRWDGSGQGYSYTPLFWAAFAVVELGADYQFLKSTWLRLGGAASELLTAHDRRLMRVSVYCFCGAWIVTVVGNVVMLVHIMAKVNHASRERAATFTAEATRELGLSSQGSLRFLRAKIRTMDEWRAVHRGAFWIVVMLSSLKMSVFPVLYCRAFGAPVFSAPISRLTASGREHKQARMINLRVSIMTVVEDLPQIMAILSVASVNNGWSSYTIMFALVASSVSLVYEMAIASDLLCCTGKRNATDSTLAKPDSGAACEPLLAGYSGGNAADARYPGEERMLSQLEDEASYLWLLKHVPRERCGSSTTTGSVPVGSCGREGGSADSLAVTAAEQTRVDAGRGSTFDSSAGDLVDSGRAPVALGAGVTAGSAGSALKALRQGSHCRSVATQTV